MINLKLRLKDYDNKFDNVNKKIMELSNTISNDNTIKDNINKLNEFKEKTKKKNFRRWNTIKSNFIMNYIKQ